MKELMRTDDPVRLSWLLARLEGASIPAQVFDQHTSSAYGGVLRALRCRVMVAEEDLPRAQRVLNEVPDDDS
ncbi:hypothetical protein JCM17960_26950 [Magnetospira thiophila]